jgi:probable F420-dependent oxidoreductase
MKFGLFGINQNDCLSPEGIATVSKAAEAAGFESLWAGEHVVLPDPRVAPSPMNPEDGMGEPLIALSFAAAHTTRLMLGTGIIILPQRNPLVLAKQIATLDAMSGGRFLFGIGVGYLEPEFKALGVPFDQKGPRTDDFLGAMRAVWYQEKPSYEGRFVSFSNINAYPKPKHVPIVVGGRTPGAYRRSVQQGDGWYGFALDPEATAESIAGLKAAEAAHGRGAGLGKLEISITPRGLPDLETAKKFADLGVERLILLPGRARTTAEYTELIDRVANELIGRV